MTATRTKVHRPYAAKRGGPPSVTTVLGCLDKPGLSWAAAKETAMFAVFQRDEWQTLPDPEAVERLRKHHKGIWDHRAAMGTAIHHVNECWTRGEEVNLVDYVEALRTGSHIWRSYQPAEVLTELNIMVDGLEEAWVALDPETISAEDVVRYNADPALVYVGQNDWRVKIGGVVHLVDVKTTGKTEPGDALYWDSWRLQLAAYRYATEIVDYDGTTETGTRPLPEVERAAILHIRANGVWEFLPVAAGETEHQRFLGLRAIYGWLKELKDSGIKGEK